MLKNSPYRYGSVAISLHWLMAIFIIVLFFLGLWMRTLGYYDPWYQRAPSIHKSIGILMFFLLSVRALWRMSNCIPAADSCLSPAEIKLSLWTHRAFYIVLLVIMISGYLISTADGRSIDVFGWFSIPALISNIEGQEDIAGAIHYWLAIIVIALATLHATAALKHHLINKDSTLKKMLPKNSSNKNSFNKNS